MGYLGPERASALPDDLIWSKERAEALLSQGYWFCTLPPAMKQSLIERSEIIRFKRNSAVYGLGDPVNGMFALLDGDMRVYTLGDERERILLRLLGPTSWIGEFHLLDGYPTRTFEVRAASECTALFLPKKQFEEISADPDNYRHFVKLTCAHSRFLVRIAVEARSDASRRAARALIRIAKMHGRQMDTGIQLTINLGQSDLASLIGVSRQYTNELISTWNEEGRLKWKGNARPLLFIEELKSLLTPLDDWMLESEGWA